MIRFYICCPNRQELVLLAGAAVKLLNRYGGHAKPVCVLKAEELPGALEKDLTAADILTCDVAADKAIPVLEQLRSSSGEMKLVVLADGSVPPTEYIRPSILPTALLWRPVTGESVSGTLGEVAALAAAGDAEQDDGGAGFRIEVRGTVKRIGYREILYFEAREKKLWLHLAHKELSFPGTLEKLMEELPEGFLRIHKSFIVNCAHTVELQYGQNQLQLSDGEILPISRSYKAEVKAVFA